MRKALEGHPATFTCDMNVSISREFMIKELSSVILSMAKKQSTRALWDLH